MEKRLSSKVYGNRIVMTYENVKRPSPIEHGLPQPLMADMALNNELKERMKKKNLLKI